MRRIVRSVWILGIVCVLGCLSRESGGDSDRIATAMKELDSSVHSGMAKLLRTQPIDWTAAAPLAQRYVELTGSLPGLVPSKGSASSWQAQASGFAAEAEHLRAAVHAHDRNGALEAWNNLTRACGNCHDAHRR